MIKKTQALLTGLMMSFCILFSGITTHAQTDSVSVLTNTKNVKKGEAVELVLKLNSASKDNTGLKAYIATLDFDESYFEPVSKQNFLSLNNWEELKYNELTRELVAIKRTGAATDEEVVKVVLIAKQNIQEGTTKVGFRNVETSRGDNDIALEEAKLDLQIVKDPTPLLNQNLNGGSNTAPTPNHFWLYLIVEVVVGGGLIIFIFRSKKAKSLCKRNKVLIALFVVSIISTQAGIAVFASTAKGDVNADGNIDYTDIRLVEDQLIHTKNLNEKEAKNADMNNDVDITVTDLALIVGKVEDRLQYEVNLDSVADKRYYNKEETVTLKFKTVMNYKADLTSVVLNGKSYNVAKSKDGVYSIQLKAPNQAGIVEYKINEVVLSNGKAVKTNFIEKIEVVKDDVTFGNYESENLKEKGKVRISFDIVDKDQGFVSGKVVVKPADGSATIEKPIAKAGKNTIDLEIATNKKYTLTIYITYKKDIEGKQLVKDKKVHEVALEYLSNENISVNEVKVIDEKGNPLTIIEKGSKVTVQFKLTNTTNYKVIKAIINKEEVTLVAKGNNVYEAVISGVNKTGEVDINVEELILENGTSVKVSNAKVKVNVLKGKPTVSDFGFERDDNSNVKALFNVNDEDATLISGFVVITDEAGTQVAKQDTLKAGKQEIQFATNGKEKFNIVVKGTYDLDGNTTDNKNHFVDQILLEEKIEITEELIEFKDIKDVELYKKGSNGVEYVSDVNVTNFVPSQYVAKVNMIHMPSMYATIDDGKVEDGQFVLTLRSSNVVQYKDGKKSYSLKVKYGSVANDVATTINFAKLVEKIKANPNGEFTLTQDLDANDISIKEGTYLGDFQGKINGNGYTIRNLNYPLFNKLENATVSNLVIDGANIKNPGKGILANTIKGSTVSNVHITNSNMNVNHHDGSGLIAGIAERESKFEGCSVSNSTISGAKRVGGFFGYARHTVTVRNSYMQGIVRSTNDAVGGLAGEHEGGQFAVISSYVDIAFEPKVKNAAGGILGYSSNNNLKVENVLSLARGSNGHTFFDSGMHGGNSYEINESGLESDAKKAQVSAIAQAEINPTFLKNTMKWDESIWDLTGATHENMPKLKNADPRGKVVKQNTTNENYIPEYARISKLPSFKKDRELAYSNMAKLMPFMDAKFYVDYGNLVNATSLLNTKPISYIFPYDKNGKVVTGLTKSNIQNIAKIKVIFNHSDVEEYPITYYKNLGNIAVYKIPAIHGLYTFDNYVMDDKDPLIQTIITEAKKYSYDAIKQAFHQEKESRAYGDNFNEYLSKQMDQVVVSILQSQSDFMPYLNNEIVREKIIKDLTAGDLLKQLIYAYNYYDRWYNIDFNGMNLRDLLFLNSRRFDDTSNAIYNMRVLKNSNKRGSEQTHEFYNQNIKYKVGDLPLRQFIELFSKTLSGVENPNDWFAKTFKGLMYEAAPYEEWRNYGWRAWDMVTERQNWILPILTLKTNDMYLVSTVRHVYIGTMNLYGDYNLREGETDKTQARERMLAKMKSFGDKFAKYYSGMLKNVPDPTKMKSKMMVNYDSRHFNYKGEKSPLNIWTTQEPVYKEFIGLVGNVGYNDVGGVAAFANGSDVYWIAHHALDDYRSATHEAVHNEDGYFLFNGKGRRAGSNAEWFTNNVNTQEFSADRTVYNLTYEFDPAEEISMNFKTERVYGKEKMQSYYKNMFDMLYVLDYLEGRAFLALTPEEKALVAQQMNGEGVEKGEKSPNDNGIQDGKGRFETLSAEDFRKMTLNTMEDLYDYRIVMNRNNNGTPASIYHTYWYMPHYNDLVGDSNAHYFISKEMLGVAGWENGYAAYASGQYKNDLEALKGITGKNSFKEYKKFRYAEVEKNIQKINFFDIEKIYNDFIAAYKKDASLNSTGNVNSKNLRRFLYNNIKRLTNDFERSVYDKAVKVSVSNAQQLITTITNNPMAYIELANDIDMSSVARADQPTYMDFAFVGRIDGNNHKLTNVTKALFKEVKFAQINDLTIENPKYNDAVNAAIANEQAVNVLYRNLKVVNSNMSTIFNFKAEGEILEGDCTITYGSVDIATKEDLIRLKNDKSPKARKQSYRLTADIDVGSIGGNAIIDGDFFGTFDGNGHTLSNMNRPLFGKLKGTVKNLNVNGGSFGQNWEQENAAIARSSEFSTIENVSVNNFRANAYRFAAGVVGVARNTKFSKIKVTNANLYSDFAYAGGVVGWSHDSSYEDIIVTGNIGAKAEHNGGVMGGSNRDVVNRAYIDVKINRNNGNDKLRNGALYGALENGPVSMKNVVVVNGTDNLYKVVVAANDKDKEVINKFLFNIYENQDSAGKSNAETNPNVVKKAPLSTIKTKEFLTKTMHFPETIWDLDNLSGDGIPSFKSMKK